MKLVSFLLSLYIITKPFYLWSSGLPQISDIILLIAFVILLFVVDKTKIRQAIRDNKYFVFFLIFVMVINLLYSIYFYDGDFLIHSLYYIFDLLGIIVFIVVFQQSKNSRKTFSNSFKISLLIQLLFFFLNIGRYYHATRYMGTFNDPNQFAYYCFLSFGFIYLLDLNKKRKMDFIFLLVTIFLIYCSASTGMLFGMVIFIILYSIPLLKKMFTNVKRLILSVIVVVLCLAIGAGVFLFTGNSFSSVFDNAIFSRVHEKIDRAEGKNDVSLWEERGYDRFLNYPYYAIFGFGEGANWRLEKDYHQNELHATLPNILFCYGIVPTILICAWFYQRLRKQNIEVLCIYLALLLESFTLINSRQVLFWVIFALCPYMMINYNINRGLRRLQDGKN